MIFAATDVVGVYRVDLERVADERGFFARAWCRREFVAHGVDDELVQVNLAFSHKRGTLRGLHFQAPPHAETKFVRCVRGAALVVAVDLRPDSPSYLKWTSLELSADNRLALLVPKGCAQGYQTLEGDTEMLYQMSAYYVPAAARGVRYDDPVFAIRWPLPPRALSPRDLAWPNYVIERHDACSLEK